MRVQLSKRLANNALVINYVTERIKSGKGQKQMAEEFKPIETQEELDKIITTRLKRERETTEKRFEGWISPEDHQKGLDELNKAFSDYKETHKNDEEIGRAHV